MKTTYSKRELYSLGMPLGQSVTRKGIGKSDTYGGGCGITCIICCISCAFCGPTLCCLNPFCCLACCLNPFCCCCSCCCCWFCCCCCGPSTPSNCGPTGSGGNTACGAAPCAPTCAPSTCLPSGCTPTCSPSCSPLNCATGCTPCCCYATLCCCTPCCCWATLCCCTPCCSPCFSKYGKYAKNLLGSVGKMLKGALCGIANNTQKQGATPGGGGGLCGAISALNSTGGPKINFCLQKVDPTQLEEAPIMKKGGGSFDSGGSNNSTDSSKTEKKPVTTTDKVINTLTNKDFQETLNPKFVECREPGMLLSQVIPHSTELQSLKQIHPSIIGHAKGGLPHKYSAAAPKGHNPEFITGLTGYYACGGGTGQSDDIPAMLHDGDYVMDAETVSALGDGSSKAGMHVLDGFRSKVPHHDTIGENPVPAKIADGEYVFPASFVTALGKGDNKQGAEILDGLREKLREHKRGAPTDKIPPKAKSPLSYIKESKE